MKQTAPKREPKQSYLDLFTSILSSSQEPPLPRTFLTDMSTNITTTMSLLLPTTSFPTPEIMHNKISIRAFSMRVSHAQTSLDVQKKHLGTSSRYIPVDLLRSMFPHASARSISEIIIKAKMVNLAQLSLDIIPHLQNEGAVTEDRLLEMDTLFPNAFVDDMDLALYTGWGRERIIKAAYEFGKTIRVYWLVKALKATKERGETTAENTYNMVRETFYAVGDEDEDPDSDAVPTKFRGWEVAGLCEGASRPNDPILPEEYIPDIKETIKSVRKIFRKGRLDDERARTLFPWDKFVVEGVKWVKTIHEFLGDVEWKVNQDFDKAEEEAKAERERKEKEAEEEREEKERLAEERFRASMSQRRRMLNESSFNHAPGPLEFPELDFSHGISPPQVQRSHTRLRTDEATLQGQGPAIRPFASFADDGNQHHDDGDQSMSPAPPGPSFDDLHISSPPDDGVMLLQKFNEQDGTAQMPPSTEPQITPQTLPYGSTPYAPLHIDDTSEQQQQQQQQPADTNTKSTGKGKGKGKQSKAAAPKKRRKRGIREDFRVPKVPIPSPTRKLRHSTANYEGVPIDLDADIQPPPPPGTDDISQQQPIDASQPHEDDLDDDVDDELKDAYANFGLPLQATARDKQGEGNEGISSALGWSIGKRKRVFPTVEDDPVPADASAQEMGGSAPPPQGQGVEDATVAAAVAQVNNSIPEGYVPYPQPQGQQEQQQQQQSQTDSKPKPKRQRKSRAKPKVIDGGDGPVDPNAPATSEPKKTTRPRASRTKDPNAPKAPRAPRKKKGQAQEQQQQQQQQEQQPPPEQIRPESHGAEVPQTQQQQQQPPSVPVSAVDASYVPLPAPPGTVAPPSVTNLPTLTDSWIPYDEPVPNNQHLTYSNITNTSMPAPAPAPIATIDQSPVLTEQSYQTASEQTQAQQAQQDQKTQQEQQELQKHQQIQQQRTEQHVQARASIPLPNQSLSHGPVPLPTQSQGGYQRVPLPTQSLPPPQSQTQSQKQPPSRPSVQQQNSCRQAQSSTWQTQPSASSNYPTNILTTPPMSAATTTSFPAKADNANQLPHITDTGHSSLNALFELPRIVSPPSTYSQPAPQSSAFPSTIKNPATLAQSQSHAYNDNTYQRGGSNATAATASTLQGADGSNYASATSTPQATLTHSYTTQQHQQQRTMIPPSGPTQPVQRTISQNTDTSFRGSNASSTAATTGGGRVTPVNAARASAYTTTRQTTTSPLSTSVQQQQQRQQQAYSRGAIAPSYAPPASSQAYQYQNTQQQQQQQRVQQQQTQSQQSHQAGNSYMSYNDYSYRMPSASARDSYPVTTASTQNIFASPTMGSTSYQTTSQTYLPTTTVAQTSSYSAAANPSVQNITNSVLPHASTMTPQAYATAAAANSAVNNSGSSSLHSQGHAQPHYGYATSTAQVAQTGPSGNQLPSPQTNPRGYSSEPWTTEEMNALKDRIILHGPKWALIKREDERSISPKLTLRSPQQIKDKAQQIAVMYYS